MDHFIEAAERWRTAEFDAAPAISAPIAVTLTRTAWEGLKNLGYDFEVDNEYNTFKDTPQYRAEAAIYAVILDMSELPVIQDKITITPAMFAAAESLVDSLWASRKIECIANEATDCDELPFIRDPFWDVEGLRLICYEAKGMLAPRLVLAEAVGI